MRPEVWLSRRGTRLRNKAITASSDDDDGGGDDDGGDDDDDDDNDDNILEQRYIRTWTKASSCLYVSFLYIIIIAVIIISIITIRFWTRLYPGIWIQRPPTQQLCLLANGCATPYKFTSLIPL